MEKESVVEVFNIACGKRTSLNQLARVIMDIMGSEAAPIHDKPRKGDIQDSVANISAARMGLDFEPDYDLVSGLSKPPGLIFQLRLLTTEFTETLNVLYLPSILEKPTNCFRDK